ncbi:hypothetical protein [Bartonella sp. LJL80]
MSKVIHTDKKKGITTTKIHNYDEWKNYYIDYNDSDTKYKRFLPIDPNGVAMKGGPMMRIDQSNVVNLSTVGRTGFEHALARDMFSY